jgi:hypothetical protein
MLEINAGLEAKSIFEDLQRRNPGRFADGQLRTLQRRIKVWQSSAGPVKEVFFTQLHRPGELSQSDFTQAFQFPLDKIKIATTKATSESIITRRFKHVDNSRLHTGYKG